MMDINILEKINFGEIDGYGDPNLEKYFLDNDYWNKIIENDIFFVVGKKGTGKSSIYRMLDKEAIKRGSLVINKDFGDFPFEKLLQLKDDNFAKPNQYQTIWKNLILNLFIHNIAKLPIENNEFFDQIVKYDNTYLKNAIDLHKEVVIKTIKKQGNLVFKNIGYAGESSSNDTFGRGEENISQINIALSELILNFFITSNYENNIIIQFDRLDDNYNQYQDIEEYYQAIISLFKTVYGFNQLLRSKSIKNAKVVLYIRSDIMKAMGNRDAESARWDDFRYDLSWNVNNMKDINNSDLLKMIDKRIRTSSLDTTNLTFAKVFEIPTSELKKCGIKYTLFGSLVLQTLFRPRDLIKFAKTLQMEVVREKTFNDSIYKTALKKYSNWLVNTEIANEINPVLGVDYKYVIELLRLCGSRTLSVKVFTERYHSIKHQFKFKPLELLEFLYSVGIIENIWKDKFGKYMHRSIFRNEGDFDRNLQLRILPAVWTGLTV